MSDKNKTKKKKKQPAQLIQPIRPSPFQINKKRTFEFSNIISVLALLISILSFGYNIFSDQMKHTEYLKFDVSNRNDNYNSQIIKCDINDEIAGFYSQLFDITISNNSDKDTSITKLETSLLFTKEQFFYNCLEKGFELPLNLKAHESKKVSVELRFPLHKKGYNTIMEKFGRNNIPFDELRREIHRTKLDMSGNEINYTEIGDDSSYIIEYKNEEGKFIPKAELFMITSENNTFLCEITPSK